MRFDITDREREQLAKHASKAAAAFMEMSDGLHENDMTKVAITTMQASLLCSPLIEQLVNIYAEASKGASSD